MASKNRVLVVGNSNLGRICEEFKKTIDDIVVFKKYQFNVLAADTLKINAFVDKLELTKSDIIVLVGQGNPTL